MARGLDWDKASKQARIASNGHEFSEPNEQVEWATLPSEARQSFINVAAAAAAAGRDLPEPSAAFLRCFREEFPDGDIVGWVVAQPEFRRALAQRGFVQKQQREQYLAKLAEIERSYKAPPRPPASLQENPIPETPEQIWEWARRQPEYAQLLKRKPPKGRFK